MIAIVLASLQILVTGLPAALLLDPAATRRRLIGMAYLLGTGIVTLLLLAMSVLQMRWSIVSVMAVDLAIAAILWLAVAQRGKAAPSPLPATSPRDRLAAVIVDVATFVVIALHGILATLAPVGSWDFWAIWGLKARVFFESGAIDWSFLEHPYNAFAHPDYPLLVPLHDVFVTLFAGQWSDRWLGILTTLFIAALLLIVRDLFEEDLPARTLAALATFGVASLALTEWIGMAEAPLVAYGAAALLLMRRALLRNDPASLTSGAVLLGFAAFTKNEGLSLVAAVLIAMLLVSWRQARRLWPALAIAAPWLLLRAIHSLSTYFTSGAVGDRVAHLFARVPELARLLAQQTVHHPLPWIAAILALAVFPASLRRERFVAIAVAMQLLFFLGAFLMTPFNLAWHVTQTWPRLVDQLAVPVAFIALVTAAQAAATRRTL